MNLESLKTIEKRVLAESSETDTPTLRRLARDDNSYVRRAALDSLKSKAFEQDLPSEWQRLSDHDYIDRLDGGPIDEKILEFLVHSEKWRIRQAVARHENTPDSLLKLLAKDHDSDVRQAVADRHLPQEWQDLDEDERIQRLKTEATSCDVLKILSCSENWVIRQHVANNTGANREILEKLANDKDDDISTDARKRLLNLCLPEDWRQLKDAERIRRLKSQTVIADEILEAFARSTNWEIRQAVAMHEGTHPSLIKKLARDTDSDVRQAVIDRRLPSEWRYLDDNQRSTKLSKNSATLEVLDILSGSSNWRVRQAVASNAKASDKLLKELARDSDFDVASAAREALLLRRLPIEWRMLDTTQMINKVKNGKATDEALEALALSTTQEIRKAVASSLTTPIELLRTLSEDADNDVKRIAKESMIRRQLPKDWMNLGDLEIVDRLHRQLASQEVLETLAMSESQYLRDAVASNANATIPILLAMKEDSSTPARIQNLLRKTWAVPVQASAESM